MILKQKRKPKNYWTKERCHEEALKYKFRSDFYRKSVSCYSKAWENRWLDEICSHMGCLGNKYKKCVYVYEFIKSNTAYVGMTFNLLQRNEQHLKRGPIFNFSSNGEEPLLKQLTDYLDVETAKYNEEFFFNKYKKNGWKLLNTAKTGAIGGGIRKWTKEKCILDAKKYHNKSDYRKSCGYRAAIRNKWLEEIYKSCGFELNNINPAKYWSKERCIKEAEKYETYTEFSKKSKTTYSLCQRHGWLIDIKRLF